MFAGKTMSYKLLLPDVRSVEGRINFWRLRYRQYDAFTHCCLRRTVQCTSVIAASVYGYQLRCVHVSICVYGLILVNLIS